MEKLSAWVISEISFSGREALIGSGLRLDENIHARDLKEVSNCLKALGFEKDDGQTRVNGTKKYLYHNARFHPFKKCSSDFFCPLFNGLHRNV